MRFVRSKVRHQKTEHIPWRPHSNYSRVIVPSEVYICYDVIITTYPLKGSVLAQPLGLTTSRCNGNNSLASLPCQHSSEKAVETDLPLPASLTTDRACGRQRCSWSTYWLRGVAPGAEQREGASDQTDGRGWSQ